MINSYMYAFPVTKQRLPQRRPIPQVTAIDYQGPANGTSVQEGGKPLTPPAKINNPEQNKPLSETQVQNWIIRRGVRDRLRDPNFLVYI